MQRSSNTFVLSLYRLFLQPDPRKEGAERFTCDVECRDAYTDSVVQKVPSYTCMGRPLSLRGREACLVGWRLNCRSSLSVAPILLVVCIVRTMAMSLNIPMLVKLSDSIACLRHRCLHREKSSKIRCVQLGNWKGAIAGTHHLWSTL